jgi:uncharacterized protein (TIGR02147 family)
VKKLTRKFVIGKTNAKRKRHMTQLHDRQRPDVSQFESYRTLVQTCYEHKHAYRRGFSYRKLASVVGVKSPNYIQLVIQGKRNLSEQTGAAIARAFDFDVTEEEYFLALIRRENAINSSERDEASRTLQRAKAALRSRSITFAQKEILSTWYHSVVREMVQFEDFRPEGTWIANQLRNLITPEQAETSLLLLLEGGFVTRDEQGVYKTNEPTLIVKRNIDPELTRKFHMQNLNTWTHVLPDAGPEESHCTLVNFAIPSDKMQDIFTQIRSFVKEIIGSHLHHEAPDRVVQFGVYLVPITQPSDSSPHAASVPKSSIDSEMKSFPPSQK